MKTFATREEISRRTCFWLLLVFCLGAILGVLAGWEASACDLDATALVRFGSSSGPAFLSGLIPLTILPLILIFADYTGKFHLFFPAFFCKGFLVCFAAACCTRCACAEGLRSLALHNVLMLPFSFCAASALRSSDAAHSGRLRRKLLAVMILLGGLSLLALNL